MSIRPVNYEEFPETSFEDMDTTFTKSSINKKQVHDQISPIFQHHNGHIPTPSSTTSSEGTIFSDKKGGYDINNKTDDEEENDDEFFDDFQEFQTRKDDFDDALHNYLKLQSDPSVFHKSTGFRNASSKINELSKDFNKRLNISRNKGRRPRAIRQPRSMMDLNTHSRQNGNSTTNPPGGMPNSLSTGDLRVKSNGTVRFKKSMPSLSSYNPTIAEEEEEEEERDLTFKGIEDNNNRQYLNNFMENTDEENEDEFIFDESLIQPQFLNKTSEASPLKLSPSQYDIIRDDALLTPRLHKRHKDWNNRQQLDSFRERRPNTSRHKSTKRSSATSRIKVIKQEIDHNTPIKNGKMYYNPKTMKWEGNEQVLDRFRKLESNDKKPLLIKTKSQIVEADSEPYDNHELKSNTDKQTKLKSKKSFINKKVVGKMMFDEDNLRWVSVHGEEEDPFAGIADISPQYHGSPNATLKAKQQNSPFYRSQSQLLPSSSHQGLDRLTSQGTTRYHSMGLSNNRDHDSSNIDPVFQLSSKLLEKFCHEENRWNRKVSGWFILGNKGPASSTSLKDRDKAEKRKSYMFEIRNMVISSTRN